MQYPVEMSRCGGLLPWLLTCTLASATALCGAALASPKTVDPAGLAKGLAAKAHCPAGATWAVIEDNRPLKKCGKLPLEQGCRLPDGRKHGVWIVYETRSNCRQPAHIRDHKNGRREGQQRLFTLVCEGKGAAERCRTVMSEAGPARDDKRHGVWKKLRDNGLRLEEGNYYEGLKHGPWSEFNAANRPWRVTCFQDDKPQWKRRFEEVKTKAMPCAVTRQKKHSTGIATVSADETKASKLVRLAQSTSKVALRIRFLQKAVQLAPANKHYKKLLAAAQAEATALK